MLGLLPLQGCMASTAEESREQTGSASEAVTTCSSNNGLNPTRAALAVAMANELGRWDPADDLAVSNYLVVLSSSAVCLHNNCADTKAILGQQDWELMYWMDQNVFNPTTFSNDMNASFNRQWTKNDDLARNHPTQLPPAHKLKKVAGPTDLGTGACGAHFVYEADHLDGTPLSASEASNLGNALCYYGFGTCGGNPYIAFTVTGQGCPSGRTCVAIDPTSSDSGSTGTTTGGSAPTYPMNRLYDPNNTMLGTACVLLSGLTGTMVSKCSTVPSTCGYLYCVH
jgi:hypothetical protein